MIEMNLAIAEQAARAAQTKARELGTPMTVSVVDEAGRLVYPARGDGAGFFRVNTLPGQCGRRQLQALDQGTGRADGQGPIVLDRRRRRRAGRAPAAIGAVPILANGRPIGAIGCGGGTGEQDHECAVAGAEAVKR